VIDWVTVVIPFTHSPIDSGSVIKILPGGEVDWRSPCRQSVPGSFDKNVSVRSMGGDGHGVATSLWIDGNPSKFLQGHNIFGSDDLLSLVYDMLIKVCRSLGIMPKLSELRMVKEGGYEISRVDINYSYELPNRKDVLAWLRAAEYKSKTRHGRSAMSGGTLYWGKKSTWWTLKAYSKGEEIAAGKKHKLPDELLATPLTDWADNKLRVELTLRGKEFIRLGVEKAKDLTMDRIKSLYSLYVRRIEMTDQIALSCEKQMELPRRLRSTYILWKNGEDLRSVLPRNTFYRHRRELLENGIDITLSQESIDVSNVVPLIRILEAKPVSIPDWAFDRGLIHSSARA